MADLPNDRKYVSSHEWVKDGGDGTVAIGITDHAQLALGDIVFTELPEPGTALSRGDDLAVIESVKAASDIYAAVSGEVLTVNEALMDAPETVNEDCYEAGWIVTLRMADPGEYNALLSAEEYRVLLDRAD